MPIQVFENIVQGTEEWFQARLGLLTASEMKLIVTPALKAASNDKERAHLYELAAQRISGYVEPSYISDDMLRGGMDEQEAKTYYARHYAPIESVGFITNDRWGFTLGYSPDGLVGQHGLIECKSRRQKYQIQTILDGEVPPEYAIQIQTGLMVSERDWCDFISYSGGLPMFVHRVYPDDEMQAAILKAATAFYERLDRALENYRTRAGDLIPTERKTYEEEIHA